MKWMAVVIAGSALLAQGGLATAKESALPPRECAAKAQAAAMKLRDMASAIEAEAAYAERHGGAFSPELTQEFVQWYRAQSAKAGSELPDLGKTNLTVDEARAGQGAVARFWRAVSDRQHAMVASVPHEAARGCQLLYR